VISLEKNGENYMCLVERPGQPSYMFFMHFKVEFEQGSNILSAEAWDRATPLKEKKHFKVVGNAVMNADGFQNQLSKVAIMQ